MAKVLIEINDEVYDRIKSHEKDIRRGDFPEDYYMRLILDGHLISEDADKTELLEYLKKEYHDAQLRKVYAGIPIETRYMKALKAVIDILEKSMVEDSNVVE